MGVSEPFLPIDEGVWDENRARTYQVGRHGFLK